MTLFERAILFATEAHAGAVDKAGLPYILHPIGVARAILLHGGSEVTAVAAVLHDVVEDTSVTLALVEREFGAEVAEIVDAVSRKPGETYREFIARAGSHPEGAKVKVADIVDNLNRLEGLPEAKGMNKRYRKALETLLPREVKEEIAETAVE